MKNKYYELNIITKNFYNEILYFIFELGFTCVQECDGKLVLHDCSDLSEIAFGIEYYANKLSNTLGVDNDCVVNMSVKNNEDWIRSYQKSINPILVENLYIRPSWEKENKKYLNIVIDPALAFGSGHHESTNSCLFFMQKYLKEGHSLIDVGCGSGILSIAAAKLGLNVDSCDTDEIAVASTKSNAKINNVNINDIWLGSILKLQKKYDFVIANIIADVIFSIKNDLKNIMKNGAYLILSGILVRYKDEIMKSFNDLKLIDQKVLNDWITLVYKNEG